VEAGPGNVIFESERMLLTNDNEPNPIRVLVTDTDEESQRNLQAIMRATRDIVLGCQATGVEDTLDYVRKSRPNIVMLDLGLPDRGATRIIRPVLQEYPDIGVIVLTLHDEKQCLLEYLNWGARGFILKPAVAETTTVSVREVYRGGRYVDPLLPHCLVSHYVANPSAPRTQQDATRVDVLTIREKEVCRYLASGYTNAEVADVLRISKRTVETHRAAIMSKVGVKSRAQLVHFAIEHGLWPEPETEHVANAVHLSVAPGE
jgi:DNA-binding NarL/FixJ family response regulator